MALTQCPDCGGKLSTEAAACPHCGRPTGQPEPEKVTSQPSTTKSSASRRLMWLVTLGIFGACFYVTVRNDDRTSSTARTSAAGMTPAQLLAVVDGRPRDDAETAAAFARLDAACPESGERVADIATNFKLLAAEKGQHYSMIELMNHLARIQEGTGSASTCAETAALSLALLGR